MYNKIKAEIKEAMRVKDVEKRDVLKLVVGKAKDELKQKNPNGNLEEISDEIMIKAVQREIKQMNQTIASLSGHEESELYKATVRKIALLEQYLPKMMTADEVAAEVARILAGMESQNFGMKMKTVMAELKGKADNKVIKEAVEKYK